MAFIDNRKQILWYLANARLFINRYTSVAPESEVSEILSRRLYPLLHGRDELLGTLEEAIDAVLFDVRIAYINEMRARNDRAQEESLESFTYTDKDCAEFWMAEAVNDIAGLIEAWTPRSRQWNLPVEFYQNLTVSRSQNERTPQRTHRAHNRLLAAYLLGAAVPERSAFARCILKRPELDVELPTSTAVVEAARGIYERGLWRDMPILADALEEAGLTNAEVLEHMRIDPHCRGCWIVDTIIGKQPKHQFYAINRHTSQHIEIPDAPPPLCACCKVYVALKTDPDQRCEKCKKDGMVKGRRGWRQLGVYDG